MAKRNFFWRGKAVRASVVKASIIGINLTMAAAAIFAKDNHTWTNRTGTLEGGIRVVELAVKRGSRVVGEFAEKRGSRVVGEWGVVDVDYALAIEIGQKAHNIVPRRRQALFWPGAAHPVKRVRHPGTKGRPYLRPAADEIYPSLANNIAIGYAQVT